MRTIVVSLVLLVVGFFAVRFVVRFAVGFVRWARTHRDEVSGFLFGVYVRDSLGEWVDDVSSSPPWFTFEGTGHHGSDGADGVGSGSGHHGPCDGGDGGGVCQ